VVLEAGRIVEMGSHDDLLARGGRYRQMVEVQTLDQPALVRVA
jgi:ABC-type multidrug transport system fused ATPase/permease subunit